MSDRLTEYLPPVVGQLDHGDQQDAERGLGEQGPERMRPVLLAGQPGERWWSRPNVPYSRMPVNNSPWIDDPNCSSCLAAMRQPTGTSLRRARPGGFLALRRKLHGKLRQRFGDSRSQRFTKEGQSAAHHDELGMKQMHHMRKPKGQVLRSLFQDELSGFVLFRSAAGGVWPRRRLNHQSMRLTCWVNHWF